MTTKHREVLCPDCGAPMELRTTWKFYYPNGDPRKFYGCSKFPECKATHGAHPNGNPMGMPGDAETKKLRIQLHDLLDPLWKKKKMRRNEAYKLLRSLVGCRDKIHIGELNKEQCQEAIKKMEEWLEVHEQERVQEI